MILILLIVSVLLLIATIYFGSWRAFFVVICMLALPIAMQLIHTSDEYFVLLGTIFLFVCTIMTARTFFIHGVYRQAKKSNQKITFFIWQVTSIIFFLIGIGYVFYLSYSDITIGTTHTLINHFSNLGIVSFIAIVLSSITTLFIVTMINQYVVKQKYVVFVDRHNLKKGERLRKVRALKHQGPVELYASKGILGSTYYYRKARPTDYAKVYDNKVTRFFEHFAASSKVPFYNEKLYSEEKIEKNKFFIFVAFFLIFISFPSYVNGTPQLKSFVNEHITAPHYTKTTANVLKCGNIERHRTSGRSSHVYYEVECDVKYSNVIKTFHFKRPSENTLSHFKKQIEQNGVPVFYNPNQTQSSYINEQTESDWIDSVFFYGSILFLIYSIYQRITSRTGKPKIEESFKSNQ